ncbi:MAG: nucleotide exchange factor GrpE [Vicinamibacteraceae bacterium]
MTDFPHDADPQTPSDDQDTATPKNMALQEDPDQILKERDDYRDRLLRSIAEFDNYRKRIERERRELSEFVSFEILHDLLPVVDDLERALAAAEGPQTVASYRSGVELILKQLAEMLRKRNVTAIETKGVDFDPHVHQAVATEPSTTHRDNEVVEELRRGYRLGERLLRPAMVKVASRG